MYRERGGKETRERVESGEDEWMDKEDRKKKEMKGR